jgi:hypothetical protein
MTTYTIFSPVPMSIMRLMEASTAHLPYAAEIEEAIGSDKKAVLRAVHALSDAGIIRGVEEAYVPENEFRAPRINYEYTPRGLSMVRMLPMPTST